MSKKRGRVTQKRVVSNTATIESAAVITTNVNAVDLEIPLKYAKSRWRSFLYWFIATTVVLLPFGLTPGTMNNYNKSYFVVVLAAVFALIIAVTAIIKKALPLLYSPFFAATGLWLAVKLLTTATSMAPSKSFWGAYNEWTDGFLYALAVALIGLIIVTLVLDMAKIKRLIELLVAQAAVLGLMTIVQAVQQGFLTQKVRPDSPLLNSDFFLSYAALLLPLILILCWVNVRSRKFAWASYYGAASLLVLAATFVTLPTHLQTILLPPLESGKKDVTYGVTDQKAIGVTNFTQTNANLERWQEWKIGLNLGSRRPFFGTGPSTTQEAFIVNKTHLDLAGWDNSHVMNRSHNDLIEQFSEEGIVGLGAYLILWTTLIFIVAKGWKNIARPDRPYAWGLSLGLAAWFGFNLLLFTTMIAGLITWIWIALLLTMVRSPRVIQTVRARQAGLTAAVTASIGMAFIGLWATHYYADDAAIADGDVITNGLTGGGYQNLTSQDRVNLRLHAESEISGAADDLPFEDYYSSQAALASIDTYFALNFTSQADAVTHTTNALRYAQQAVRANPYDPQNLQNLGGIQYYLARAGSTDERQGIALIDHAIDLTPKSVAWYLNAAKIAQLKKDYQLAKSYISRGMAATPKQSDHDQLRALSDSFPKT
jgi:hypothetical protein